MLVINFLEILAFIVLQTCSIGLYFGEYGGKWIKSMFKMLYNSVKTVAWWTL